MKKLIVLFLSLLVVGGIFQACDDTKTYAEMLEDEKNAVNAFISTRNIKTISVEEFEKDTITDLASNEYVVFSNGVYMQIVNRGSNNPDSTFKTNNLILARFMEVDIMANDTTYVSNVHNPVESFNIYPDEFRYTVSETTTYGIFLAGSDADPRTYSGYSMYYAYGTAVPEGWLSVLGYLRDGAAVKLIVPAAMGHTIASQYVYPYFYDIRKFSIY